MVQNVEFKVDVDGLRWEQIPVAFVFDLSDMTFDQVEEYCDSVAIRMCKGTGKTIRWERQGVGQGHYIGPSFIKMD